MKALVFALFASVAAVTMLPAHAEEKSTAPAKDYVILKLNGKDIKKSEVEALWKVMFGANGTEVPPFDGFDANVQRNVVRGLATERLLAQEAEKAGLEKRPDVQEKLEQARRQVLIQSLLADKTKDVVTEPKLKAEYDKRVKDMGKQEEVRARHILVKTEEEAKEIAKQLDKGVSFETLAKEKSEDKASGAQGGDLGYFTPDRMVPEFAKAAFALKKGAVSKPVKSDFGWHVIKLEDRRKVTPPAYEQVKPQIKEDLGNKVVQGYVQELLGKADVKYYGADGKEIPFNPPAAAPAVVPPAAQ